MWHSFMADNDPDRDNPTEAWLLEVLKVADVIMAQIMKDIQNGRTLRTERAGEVASILPRDTRDTRRREN
jgi:hypothetical protein